MLTLYSIFFLIIFQVTIFLYHKRNPGEGVASQLAFIPFLSIPYLINHNIDQDLWSHEFTLFTIPNFLCLLLVSLNISKFKKRALRLPKVELVFLVGFILFTLIGSLSSYNHNWSYLQIAQSVPLLIVSLIAAAHTDTISKISVRCFTYSLLGLALINIVLVILAIILEKADNIFEARNAGSIYASTAFLASALLLLPFSMKIWKSKIGNITLALTILASILSLSRSVLFIVFPLLMLLLKNRRILNGKKLLTVLTISILIILTFPALIYENWINRLIDTPSALFIRWNEFSPYFQYKSEALTQGKGWGMTPFFHASGYTDLHNIIMTEAYESGYLAGISLLLLLATSLYKSVINLSRKNRIGFSNIFSVFYLNFLMLSLTTGTVTSYRGPSSYCGVFIGVFLMIIVGQVHREFVEKKT